MSGLAKLLLPMLCLIALSAWSEEIDAAVAENMDFLIHFDEVENLETFDREPIAKPSPPAEVTNHEGASL